MNRYTLYGLSTAVLVVDQLTKWKASRSLFPDRPVMVVPNLFDLTLVSNKGGAFGILQNGTWWLVLAALAAIVAIVSYTMRSAQPMPRLLGFALALPLGGAVGNLIDRVRLGYVVDFFHAHVGLHEWPVFNVADSCICVGVCLMAIHFWSRPVPAPAEPPASVKEPV